MKVLHVLPNFWPAIGGIEDFTLNLCRQSEKKKIETEVVCFNTRFENRLLKSEDRIGKTKIRRLERIGIPQYYFSPKLLQAIKQSNPDIIHVHGIGPISDFIALTKPLHKRKIIVNTHGGFFHTKKSQLRKQIYYSLFCPLFLKKYDLVIADSKSDFDIFSKSCGKKITLLEDGVNTQKFEKLRKKTEKNSFLCVGRISKNKRLHLLLEVFAKVKEKGKKFKLYIIGKDFDNLLSELNEKAKALKIQNEVQFLGNVPDSELQKHYSKAEFFVSASQYEGFGISAIEAMAAECIPILHENDSFKNFVKDSENGFLADFEKTGKTAEKISKIMEESNKNRKSLENLRKTARESVRKFSWKSKIKEWKKVYKSLAG